MSNHGRVKSVGRTIIKSNGSPATFPTKILSQRINDRGYSEVKLSIDGYGLYYKVHRLVAQSFIDNPECKQEVNHKDCDKQNNHVDNLEWATHSENQRHAFDNGLYDRKGKANGCNKVSENDVIDIRKRKVIGEKRMKVYKDYEDVISFDGFKLIWYGYNWKHITVEEKGNVQ